MRYAVLLGIEKVAESTSLTDAITAATDQSRTHPVRLVRIIDTHTDSIAFEIRNGEVAYYG
jgi:hypothetical protein